MGIIGCYYICVLYRYGLYLSPLIPACKIMQHQLRWKIEWLECRGLLRIQWHCTIECNDKYFPVKFEMYRLTVHQIRSWVFHVKPLSGMYTFYFSWRGTDNENWARFLLLVWAQATSDTPMGSQSKPTAYIVHTIKLHVFVLLF